MQGRIIIEFNFDSNTPVVNFMVPKDSPDLRDRMMKRFIEMLGGSSSWCKFEFKDWGGEHYTVGLIRPIAPEELEIESKIMAKQSSLLYKHPKRDSVTH